MLESGETVHCNLSGGKQAVLKVPPMTSNQPERAINLITHLHMYTSRKHTPRGNAVEMFKEKHTYQNIYTENRNYCPTQTRVYV